MQKYQKEFIENLKSLRKKQKLSQAALAEFCGVATGTIGNIECAVAKPSFDLIIKMADIFKIHPAELFASQKTISKISSKLESESNSEFLKGLVRQIEERL
mgnify:CR=1 FL=1